MSDLPVLLCLRLRKLLNFCIQKLLKKKEKEICGCCTSTTSKAGVFKPFCHGRLD